MFGDYGFVLLGVLCCECVVYDMEDVFVIEKIMCED